MNLSIDIARRYLFGKKSTNAINIISWISVLGVAIGTAALILILSVFNGFEVLISSLFNAFNPDIIITPKEGKDFEDREEVFKGLMDINGVEAVSKTMEEIVLFQYDNVQEVGILKGVDTYFNAVTSIDSTIRRGTFLLQEKGISYGVIGMGIANKLGVTIQDGFTPIVVYFPNLGSSSPFSQNYSSQVLYPGGIFTVQTERDFEVIISSLAFLQKLRSDANSIGAYELKLNPKAREKDIKKEITAILGDGFYIKNRFEQDEAFLKLMNIEKWVSFALAGFAFVLIAFNLVGSLWMIVLDKRKDISILKSMGFTDRGIQMLFILEGIFICGLGIIIGLIMAFVFYGLQKQFGIISIPSGFIINAYPIEMRFYDLLVVGITVFSIGFLASLPGSIRARNIKSFIREE